MLFFVEKLLIISMRMEKSGKRCVRLLGKLLGIFPVRYSYRMEKRLFDGNWDPAKRYRKRRRQTKHRRKNRGGK